MGVCLLLLAVLVLASPAISQPAADDAPEEGEGFYRRKSPDRYNPPAAPTPSPSLSSADDVQPEQPSQKMTIELKMPAVHPAKVSQSALYRATIQEQINHLEIISTRHICLFTRHNNIH